MANENKKDFNTMMRNNKDMPKIQVVAIIVSDPGEALKRISRFCSELRAA